MPVTIMVRREPDNFYRAYLGSSPKIWASAATPTLAIGHLVNMRPEIFNIVIDFSMSDKEASDA